ncbi:hypothetical protein DFJ74DRAFT_680316 [Hyaloraphidium curvatum]|nr:hypothetical protein DFJ74DRAFT_680316 [Hyaloraphidium curvatum]
MKRNAGYGQQRAGNAPRPFVSPMIRPPYGASQFPGDRPANFSESRPAHMDQGRELFAYDEDARDGRAFGPAYDEDDVPDAYGSWNAPDRGEDEFMIAQSRPANRASRLPPRFAARPTDLAPQFQGTRGGDHGNLGYGPIARAQPLRPSIGGSDGNPFYQDQAEDYAWQRNSDFYEEQIEDAQDDAPDFEHLQHGPRDAYNTPYQARTANVYGDDFHAMAQPDGRAAQYDYAPGHEANFGAPHGYGPGQEDNFGPQASRGRPLRQQTVLGRDGRTLNLRSVSELPDRFRSLWNFPYFNAMQSECFDVAYNTGRNVVVSAPTSAGKTVVLELAIARELMKADRENVKIIYMAPTRALCTERARDWSARFRTLGITCGELTGDTAHDEIRNVQRAQIIVTTPEKWDSISRKWRDHQALFNLVKLFMVDEVHMLGEEKRGATLEVVVGRMKQKAALNSISGASGPSNEAVRFVAVSATVPNVHDIAKWLCDPSGAAAEVRIFGEDYRPVILCKEVLGYPRGERMNEFIFEQTLDSKLLDVLERFSQGKPALVFCATRKSAEHAAQTLSKVAVERVIATRKHPFVSSARIQQHLNSMRNNFQDRKIGELIPHAVAYHHAGLSMEDRRQLEGAFLKGDIKVLCTTSTLAVGVNLPAYLVVIKGTCQYHNSKYVPISDLDLFQMIGRAGRPQFDDSGCAVIMTEEGNRAKYEALVSGQETIESSLHESLIEHINAEVVLGTVTDLTLAVKWLKATFLFIRAKANPGHYRFKTKLPDHMPVEQRLESLALKDLEKLEQHQFVKLRDGKMLESTELGPIMAKFYIRFETMVEICKLKPGSTVKDVLDALSKASEFNDATRMNMGDKGILNDLNKKHGLRFPLKTKVKTLDHKISLLIQAALGAIPIVGQNSRPIMAQEQSYVVMQAQRIARCILEVAVIRKDFRFVRSAVEMLQSLQAKTWGQGSGLLLRQLDGLGVEFARKLDISGIRDFAALRACDPGRIEMAVGRQPPFGHKVLESLKSLPQLELRIRKFQDVDSAELELFVTLGLANPSIKSSPSVVLFCGVSDGPLVEFYRIYCSKLRDGPKEFRFKAPIMSTSTKVYIRAMCEDYAGVDISEEIAPEINPRIFMRIMQQSKDKKIPSSTSGEVTLADLREKQEAGPAGDPASDDLLFGVDLDDVVHAGGPAGAVVGAAEASNSFFGIDDEAVLALAGDNLASDDVDDDVPPLPPPLDLRTAPAPSAAIARPQEQSKSVQATVQQGPRAQGAAPGARVESRTDQMQTAQAGLEPDTVPCNHACKDKMKCRHLCCKTGIPRKAARRRKAESPADAAFGAVENDSQNEFRPDGGVRQVSKALEAPPPEKRRQPVWEIVDPAPSPSSSASSSLPEITAPKRKLKRPIVEDSETEGSQPPGSKRERLEGGSGSARSLSLPSKPPQNGKRISGALATDENTSFFDLSVRKKAVEYLPKAAHPIPVFDLEEADATETKSPNKASTPSLPSLADAWQIPDFGFPAPPVPSSHASSPNPKPSSPPRQLLQERQPPAKASTSWGRKLYDDFPPEPKQQPITLASRAASLPRLPGLREAAFPQKQRLATAASPKKDSPAASIAAHAPSRMPAAASAQTVKASAGTVRLRSWLQKVVVDNGEA